MIGNFRPRLRPEEANRVVLALMGLASEFVAWGQKSSNRGLARMDYVEALQCTALARRIDNGRPGGPFMAEAISKIEQSIPQ